MKNNRTDIEEIVNHFFQAGKIILQKKKSHAPQFIFHHSKTDSYDLMIARFYNELEKQLLISFLKNKVKKDQIDYYLFIAEAYMVKAHYPDQTRISH